MVSFSGMLGIGPVDQQQIDARHLELLDAVARRALEVAGAQVARPDLGGDEDLVARHARGAKPLAHRLLVAVHRRGVDVPVAEPHRLVDHPRRRSCRAGPRCRDRPAECARRPLRRMRIHGSASRISNDAEAAKWRKGRAMPTRLPRPALRSTGASGRACGSAPKTPRPAPRRAAEQRAGRAARLALALLPVAHRLDRHADAGGELGLGQPGLRADAAGVAGVGLRRPLGLDRRREDRADRPPAAPAATPARCRRQGSRPDVRRPSVAPASSSASCRSGAEQVD